jgi:hypothetical protein
MSKSQPIERYIAIAADEDTLMLGAKPRPMTLEFWDTGIELTLDIFTPDAGLRITIPKAEALKFAHWVTVEEPMPSEDTPGPERPSILRRVLTWRPRS